MERFFKKITQSGILGCFYCGVDSKPLLIFMVSLIGCLALATLFAGLSFWLRGGFKRHESIKYEIFEMEDRV